MWSEDQSELLSLEVLIDRFGLRTRTCRTKSKYSDWRNERSEFRIGMIQLKTIVSNATNESVRKGLDWTEWFSRDFTLSVWCTSSSQNDLAAWSEDDRWYGLFALLLDKYVNLRKNYKMWRSATLLNVKALLLNVYSLFWCLLLSSTDKGSSSRLNRLFLRFSFWQFVQFQTPKQRTIVLDKLLSLWSRRFDNFNLFHKWNTVNPWKRCSHSVSCHWCNKNQNWSSNFWCLYYSYQK
jgi:hypothetical protein